MGITPRHLQALMNVQCTRHARKASRQGEGRAWQGRAGLDHCPEISGPCGGSLIAAAR